MLSSFFYDGVQAIEAKCIQFKAKFTTFNIASI